MTWGIDLVSFEGLVPCELACDKLVDVNPKRFLALGGIYSLSCFPCRMQPLSEIKAHRSLWCGACVMACLELFGLIKSSSFVQVRSCVLKLLGPPAEGGICDFSFQVSTPQRVIRISASLCGKHVVRPRRRKYGACCVLIGAVACFQAYYSTPL